MSELSAELPSSLRTAVETALHRSIRSARRLHGGCIHNAFQITLGDGGDAFLKTSPNAAPHMFQAEARGLAWLKEADALRVPEVWAFSEAGSADPFLVLEHIEPGDRVADFDERLGRGLARLHRYGAPGFGLDHDNFIGSLPQVNRPHDRWADFYWAERLEPQLQRAVDRKLVTPSIRAGFDHVSAHLEDRCGPIEPPARLHGDLWAGNIHVDPAGFPALIDPAVYGGHREIDLAMMQFSASLSARAIDAYHEEYLLSAGWRERVGLYQLYPLLVHVNLFGAGYVGPLERTLARC